MAWQQPTNWTDAKGCLKRMFPEDELRGSIVARLLPLAEAQRLEYFDEAEGAVKASLLDLAGRDSGEQALGDVMQEIRKLAHGQEELAQKIQRSNEQLTQEIEQSQDAVTAEALEKLHKCVFVIKEKRNSPGGIGVGTFVAPERAVTANHNLGDAVVGSTIYGVIPKSDFVESPVRLRFKVKERNAEFDYAVLSIGDPHDYLSVYMGDANVLKCKRLAMCAFQFAIEGDLREFDPSSLGVMPAQGVKLSAHSDFLVYTSETWPGDSGGALVMRAGELVGLHIAGVNYLKELSHQSDDELEVRVAGVESSLRNVIKSVSSGCVAVLARKFMQSL